MLSWGAALSEGSTVPQDQDQPVEKVFGFAGGSLDDGLNPFGEHGRVGHRGEVLTARILQRVFKDASDVFIGHDVDIPSKTLGIPGSKAANIDHVLIRGNRVVLIDSKVWAQGFYYGGRWGLDYGRRRKEKGKTIKEAFPPASKKTVGLAVDRFTALLAPWRPTIIGILLIHPQGAGKSSYWALRLPDGVRKVVAGSRTDSELRSLVGSGNGKAADVAMVNAVRAFVRR